MIRVINTVPVYENDGKEVKPPETMSIAVNSHNIRCEWVVVIIEGCRLTVNAKDLRAAIENATNISTF